MALVFGFSNGYASGNRPKTSPGVFFIDRGGSAKRYPLPPPLRRVLNREMEIRALEEKDLAAIKVCADKNIGRDYFSPQELQDCFTKSQSGGVMCSFILEDEGGEIQGFRLAFPPGTWSKGKGSHLRPDLWQVPLDKVGYFQSLFLSDSAQGHGWGPKLSEATLAAFKKLGTKAIVTHAWVESPNNSSIRYLTKFGFEKVTSHPEYWVDIDYECVLDGKPCRCTADEMIKYLERP